MGGQNSHERPNAEKEEPIKGQPVPEDEKKEKDSKSDEEQKSDKKKKHHKHHQKEATDTKEPEVVATKPEVPTEKEKKEKEKEKVKDKKEEKTVAPTSKSKKKEKEAPKPQSSGGLFSFGGKVAYKNQKEKRVNAEYDFFFKILICGDSGTGKSCFLLRFCDDSFFGETFISTIGVDFKIRTLELGGKVVKLQIWDTAGQERFRTITSSYYRGAQGIFIAYDITDSTSFANVKQWISEIERYACENVSVFILGMKSDLKEKREVSKKDAKDFAASVGIPWKECSSKLNLNVTESVLGMVAAIGNRLGLAFATADAVFDVSKAADISDDDADSFSEGELQTALTEKPKQATSAPASKSAVKHKAKKADVNVFRLGLNTLSEEVSLMTGDPIMCKRCGVIFGALSKIKAMLPSDARKQSEATALGPSFTPAPPIHVRFEGCSWVGQTAPTASEDSAAESAAPFWTCEFCGAANPIDPDEAREAMSAPCVDYLVQPAPHVNDAEMSSILIFAIDISGSMCVTTEVDGNLDLKGSSANLAKRQEATKEFGSQYLPHEKRGVTHVSRLQCLQIAIEQQIKRLERENPDKRVGIVAFNNEVLIVGDGTQEPIVIAGDRLGAWDELKRIGAAFVLNKKARDSSKALLKSLYTLEESGATALGPALLVAIEMAGTAPGSSIVLCTDGLANQGLGSLEGKEKDFVAFYTECAEQAVLRGVTVSVLSIIGSDCRLEALSVLTEKTGGTVERVDPQVLTKQLDAIVGAPQTIAYGTMAMVLLHRGMKFRGEMDDENEQRFWVVKDLGNVTTASACTFSYDFRPKEECDMSTMTEVPFQVQILFTKPNGAIHLRVSTATVSLTDNRDEAEKNANVSILGAHAAKAAAKLAKAGDYEQAQLATRAAQKLLQRAGADEEELFNFGTQVEVMDKVLRTERIKDEASSSASSTSAPGANVKVDKKQKARQQNRDDEAAAAISNLLA